MRIDDELEREFRRVAFIVFGQRKGSLSRAVEEAIRLWLASVGNRHEVSFADLEVRIPLDKRDIVSKIIEECNQAEKEKIHRLLEALRVS